MPLSAGCEGSLAVGFMKLLYDGAGVFRVNNVATVFNDFRVTNVAGVFAIRWSWMHPEIPGA